MAAAATQNAQVINGPSGQQQFASLYVGDLHPDVSENTLYDIFNAIGPVASIRVCRDTTTRRSLGYAYVNYHAVPDAERAMESLNYTTIKDRCCRIMWSHRDPALRKSGHGNIFVKNLDLNIDHKALYDTFSLFGNILSCKVALNQKGESLGYGFVHYETDDAANQAIERVHNMQIGDKQVEVVPFVRREQRNIPEKKFTNVYVKNFPNSWTEQLLTKKFQIFGATDSVALRHDKKGRAFGFVNFNTPESAADAVAEMHGTDQRDDKTEPLEEEDKLYVQRAQSKTERVIELKSKLIGTQIQPEPQGVNLYIKNLDDHIDDTKLEELFQQFGEIKSVKVMQDDNGISRGFGFVSFSSSEHATKAVTEMHLKLISGKPLYVGLAEKKEVRQARLSERFRAVPTGARPNMINASNQATMYNMRPQMNMMQPMFDQWRNPMRPQMMMPTNMMYGMRGMMPTMARPKAMVNNRNNMYKFTSQARNQQAPMMQGMNNGVQGQRPVSSQVDSATMASQLAAAEPGMQKQMLGEQIFTRVIKHQPELAGKITGMMLEMDNSELIMLLDSDTQMTNKIDEALGVIQGRA